MVSLKGILNRVCNNYNQKALKVRKVYSLLSVTFPLIDKLFTHVRKSHVISLISRGKNHCGKIILFILLFRDVTIVSGQNVRLLYAANTIKTTPTERTWEQINVPLGNQLTPSTRELLLVYLDHFSSLYKIDYIIPDFHIEPFCKCRLSAEKCQIHVGYSYCRSVILLPHVRVKGHLGDDNQLLFK